MKHCAVIQGVGHYVPEKVVTNYDLAKVMDTSHEWIVERSGIEERRMADVSEGTSDLATKAGQAALDSAKLKAEDLDLILTATISPDHYFPGLGVMVQDKLQAKCIPALDIRGQCSGFSWSLATADAFIRSGSYRKILVVGAEIHSRLMEFSTRGRNVAVLFGDAAGAVILTSQDSSESPSATNEQRGIIDSHMGSDGSGCSFLLCERPGLGAGRKEFLSLQEAQERAYSPHMEGRQVFKNAVLRMEEAAKALMTKHKITADEIDLLIPHQANLRISEMLRQKLKLPSEKVFNNISKFGNTTGATLPLCMSQASEQGLLRPGMLVMTVAFGSGFTWGANLLRW